MKLLQVVKHWLTITILICCTIIAAILIGTPFLIDIGIERWTMSRGQEAQVENVDFNPFTGRLSMDNLVVETDSGRILHIPHAFLRFSWKQLFAKHFHLRELTVRDTFLVVDRFEEVGFRVGGFIVQELVGATDEDSGPGWGVGIDRFELVNSRVEYQTPEITATYHIDQYTLTGLESWDEENTVVFELQGRIDDSPIKVKTKIIPFAAERKWDGTLLLQNGSLALFTKALAPGMPMVGRIDIDKKVQASLQRDGTLYIATDGNIGIEQLAMEYDQNNISQAELNWQGKLTGKKIPNQGMTLNLDGWLLGRGLGAAMPAQGLEGKLGNFSLQGRTVLTQADNTLSIATNAELSGESAAVVDTGGNTYSIAMNSFTVKPGPDGLQATRQENGAVLFAFAGKFATEQLTVEYDQNTLSEEKLTWEGHLSGKGLPQKKELVLQVDSRLLGKGLGIAVPSKGLQAKLAGFNFQGKTALTQLEDTLTMALTAELTGNNTLIADTERNLNLFQANSFTANGIQAENIDTIDITKIAFLQPVVVSAQQETKQTAPLLQGAAIEIGAITLTNLQNLSIKDLHLQDFQFFVTRHEDGSFYLIDELLGEPAVSEQETAPGQGEATLAPLQLRLQNLRITGNSSVRFEDEHPFRPYRTTFLINKFLLTDIDTAHKDKPAGIQLDGMAGQYGTAKINGKIYPFQKPLSFDLDSTIKALAMPPLSSYTGPAIGYILTSGQMDAEIKFVVDKGEMLAENALLLRNLKVKPEDPAKMGEHGKQLGVPLESGLAMLRNRKDEIKLKITLQGNIENPEFDMQDAVNQALAKALQFGAINYLKYALQPFGTYLAIAEVAGKAGKELTKVRLDPVILAAGEQELDETAAQYIEKVAGILNDRPGLRIEICGKAVEADRTALRDRQIEHLKEQAETKKKEDKEQAQPYEVTIPDALLLALAEKRAQQVKETLFGQYGVDHSRMYLCLPEIIATPGSRPSVDLLID